MYPLGWARMDAGLPKVALRHTPPVPSRSCLMMETLTVAQVLSGTHGQVCRSKVAEDT